MQFLIPSWQAIAWKCCHLVLIYENELRCSKNVFVWNEFSLWRRLKTESRDNKWSHVIHSRDGFRFRSKLSNNSEIPIVAYPIYLHDGDTNYSLLVCDDHYYSSPPFKISDLTLLKEF